MADTIKPDEPRKTALDELPTILPDVTLPVSQEWSDEPLVVQLRYGVKVPLPPKQEPLSLKEIPKLRSLSNRCIHQNDPTICSVCNLKVELAPAAEPLTLEEEVQKKLAERPKEKKKPVRKKRDVNQLLNLKEKVNLRRQYGLEPRQLAAILDNKEFNKPYLATDEECGQTPKMQRWFKEIQAKKGKSIYRKGILVRPGTMAEWRNLLPLKQVTCLTTPEIAFYKDYASRNLTSDEMRSKHGEVSDEQLRILENKIVRHGLHLNLWHIPKTGVVHDIAGDEERLEVQGVLRGTSDLGGTVHSLVRRGAKAFETASRMSSGHGADEETGGPEHDDYSDDSSS